MIIKEQKQKGAIALILSIFVLSGLLVISLAISNLSLGQMAMTEQIEESVGAYAAADAGIEYAMSIINRVSGLGIINFYNAISADIGSSFNSSRTCSGASTIWFVVNSDAVFCLEPVRFGGNIRFLKAIGEFKGEIRRSIETRPNP